MDALVAATSILLSPENVRRNGGEKPLCPLKNKHKNEFDKIGKSVKLHGVQHGKNVLSL